MNTIGLECLECRSLDAIALRQPVCVLDFLPGLKAGDSYGAYLGIEPG